MKLRVLAATAAVLLAAGCGSGQQAAGPATDGAVTAAPEPTATTLTVFAAASLRETFTAIGDRFEADNPGTTVTINFAGSSELAQQIVQGAPADVFAAASDATMRTVTDAGRTAADPVSFAQNSLQIAVAPGNPEGIATFADLARPGLLVVMCAEGVPCGDAARRIETATGVDVPQVSDEPDVRSALGKVQSGDADAGLVYVTDVAAAGDAVQGIPFPESAQAVTNYPIATVRDSPNAELAQRFVEAVTSEQGRQTLQTAGFQTP